MPEQHLSQFNIIRLRCPPDDPRVAEFAEAVDRNQALAESSEGFLWRLSEAPPNPVDSNLFDDPLTSVTLSVWRDLESLERFIWHTEHTDYFRRCKQWFEPTVEPNFVMWWVRPGHRPTLAEAKARLQFLRSKGPTRHAFDWRLTAVG